MISTKDIPTGGGNTPKTLQPGNTSVKISSIKLDKFPWGNDAYHVVLSCEGVDQGADFEGFFIDKEKEALGRHAGQVGNIRSGQWAYETKDLPSGVHIDRDVEITKFLKNLAVAVGFNDWYEGQDGKHATIESLIDKLNEDAPFEGKFINVCLGGREYENKGGYTNYDLFFPRFSKSGVPFEAMDVPTSKLLAFNSDSHIIKKKVKEISEFEASASGAASEDFTL